jgi:hypothetical protein
MVFVLSDLRGTKMQKRLSAVVLALAVAVAVIGGVLATGAIARDPTQAVIGDAELAKLPVSEQRRLGQLEQGQQGLVMESLPQETRERLERDPAPDAELRIIEGYDDSLVLREADVTVHLRSSLTAPSGRSAGGYGTGMERSRRRVLTTTGSRRSSARFRARCTTCCMRTAAGPDDRAPASDRSGPRDRALPRRDAGGGGRAHRAVEVVRTGPVDQPHMQWSTPSGTVIALATSGFDDATITAIIEGVDGD